MEMIAYGLPILILGFVLGYAVVRSGRLRPKERQQLDANTKAAQRRDDPQK